MKLIADLLSFPCSYSLKVIGKNSNEFHAVVRAILEKHIDEGDKTTYHIKTSSGDKYAAITATFPAQNKAQINDIYLELGKHDLVIMPL